MTLDFSASNNAGRRALSAAAITISLNCLKALNAKAAAGTRPQRLNIYLHYTRSCRRWSIVCFSIHSSSDKSTL